MVALHRKEQWVLEAEIMGVVDRASLNECFLQHTVHVVVLSLTSEPTLYSRPEFPTIFIFNFISPVRFTTTLMLGQRQLLKRAAPNRSLFTFHCVYRPLNH